MLPVHKTRYQAAFDFLSQDLPQVKQNDRTWQALLQSSSLSDAEATQALTMDGSEPLIFASDLGLSVFSQFDTQVPGRIEIGMEVLSRFAAAPRDAAAQQFLRAKVLHEVCHWACFRKQVPDNDTAGEAFETAAFGLELPWWPGSGVTAVGGVGVATGAAGSVGAPAPAVPGTAGGDVFTDAAARARLIASLLGQRGFAPGRQADPAHAVFGGADVAQSVRRGFRNNNPGNIRVGDTWRGLADPVDQTAFQRSEKNFCVFREPEWGLRAMAILLRKYKTEHGLDTPRKIIARWAPASDNNDVASYAAQLALALGIGPDDFADATKDKTLLPMMRAIARHENGERPPYADVQYQAALVLA